MASQFYLNRGHRCAQTAIKSTVTGDAFPLRELDMFTGRRGKEITTPIQVAYCLKNLGVDFIYPVKPLFLEEDFRKIQEITLKQFNKETFDKTNFKFIEKAKNELIAFGKYSLRNDFNFNEINNLIEKGNMPICLINYDIYVGRENKNSGHYLIIHEIGKDFVRIMDSGPCNASPDKKIPRRILEESLMQTPLDYGLVFIKKGF